jgi:hypothetical protein
MEKEKMARRLLILSLLIFAASFFLPAYEAHNATYPGWFCAYFCFLWPLEERFTEWQSFYYSAFNLSNLFMVIVPISILLRRARRSPVFLRIAQLVLIIHVISWLFFERIEDGVILPGYYVWLSSMFLALPAIQMGHAAEGRDGGTVERRYGGKEETEFGMRKAER